MPSFGAASRADGDTRLGVSLRCIQDQERRCLVPCGQVIVHHLSRLFHCALAAASLLLDEGASQFQRRFVTSIAKPHPVLTKLSLNFFFSPLFCFFCKRAQTEKKNTPQVEGGDLISTGYRARSTRRSRSIGCKRCRLSKITRSEIFCFILLLLLLLLF